MNKEQLAESLEDGIRENIYKFSAHADSNYCLNEHAIDYLKSIAAFSYLIPKELGGEGKTVRETCKLISLVAE